MNNNVSMGVATGGFQYPGVGQVDPNQMGAWGMTQPPPVPMPVLPNATGVSTSGINGTTLGGVGTGAGMVSQPIGIEGVTNNILNGDPTAGLPAAGGDAASGGFFGDGSGLGWNLGTAQTIAGGLQAFGNLYSSFQQTKMAREQLNFQKEAYRENLDNTKQNYNTTLEDRIKSRYAYEGKSEKEANSYLDKHKL